jgi:hypothetical protein
VEDILEVLDAINGDSLNLTKRVQNTSLFTDHILESKSGITKGFNALKEKHFETNTYSKLLREIRFLDKRFGRIKFNQIDNQPIRDSAFQRFVTRDNFHSVLGMISEFFVMLNGYSAHSPFHIRPIYQVDPNSFCQLDVIRKLEDSQLKLIYQWNFLANHLRISKSDIKEVNDMISKWRQTQTKVLQKHCDHILKNTDILAKFIATKC